MAMAREAALIDAGNARTAMSCVLQRRDREIAPLLVAGGDDDLAAGARDNPVFHRDRTARPDRCRLAQRSAGAFVARARDVDPFRFIRIRCRGGIARCVIQHDSRYAAILTNSTVYCLFLDARLAVTYAPHKSAARFAAPQTSGGLHEARPLHRRRAGGARRPARLGAAGTADRFPQHHPAAAPSSAAISTRLAAWPRTKAGRRTATSSAACRRRSSTPTTRPRPMSP